MMSFSITGQQINFIWFEKEILSHQSKIGVEKIRGFANQISL